MPKSGFYGWQLLAVLWVVLLVNLAFPAYGSTVINTYMAADLHLDREMLLGGALVIVGSLLMFLLYRRRVPGWCGVADRHPATDARSCQNRRSRC